MNSIIKALAVSVLLVACGGVETTTTPVLADGGACGDTWADYGQTFFAGNCRSCHEHTAQFATAASVQAQNALITSEIRTGRMPEGLTLTAAEKTRILTFLSCGAN